MNNSISQKSLIYTVTKTEASKEPETKIYQSGYSDVVKNDKHKYFVLRDDEWEECSEQEYEAVKSIQDKALDTLKVKRAGLYTVPKTVPVRPPEDELSRLRRENRQLRQLINSKNL